MSNDHSKRLARCGGGATTARVPNSNALAVAVAAAWHRAIRLTSYGCVNCLQPPPRHHHRRRVASTHASYCIIYADPVRGATAISAADDRWGRYMNGSMMGPYMGSCRMEMIM